MTAEQAALCAMSLSAVAAGDRAVGIVVFALREAGAARVVSS